MKRCLNCMQEYEDNYGDACPNCGYQGEATQDGGICLEPGTILQGRYIIGTVIRTRDIDIFYNAWDALFERKVQVQEYFPRYCATRAGGTEVNVYSAKTEQYLEGMRLFCGQSKELIRLYKDEDVVTYHAAFQENRTAYAIMDVLEERTLKSWLGGRMLREQEILDLMRQAIRAVDKCHKLGIYHGLIGQDTFWMTERGSLVLKDFGSWRYISGKPGIVSYGNVGGEIDVFGLAKTFCQIATGMDTEDEKELRKGLGNGTPLNRRVVGALKKALSHETKLLDDFRRDLDGKGEKRSGLSLPRWTYIVGGGAAMVVVISVSAFAFVRYGGLDKMQGMEMPWKKKVESEEKTEAVIPEVLDLSREEGERLLREAGFHDIKWEEEPSYGTHNTIVKISPQEGETCGLDTEILVTVCENEEGLQWDEGSEEKVVNEGNEESTEGTGEDDGAENPKVPSVIGLDREVAEGELKKLDFIVDVEEEYSDNKQLGKVIDQIPKAGVSLNEGEHVVIKVSKGKEKITMRNVQKKTESEAKEIIDGLGLAVGKVTREYSDAVPKGQVISQSIPANAEAKRGDKVNLVISDGRNPAAAQPNKDDARKKADEEARKQSEEAARKASEEAVKKESEEAAKRASEEAARKASEEEAKKASEEAARKASEEEAKKVPEQSDKRREDEREANIGEEDEKDSGQIGQREEETSQSVSPQGPGEQTLSNPKDSSVSPGPSGV